MKLIYKYSLLILPMFCLFSCEKETEGVSKVTYYCDLTLKGNLFEFAALGGTYTEPGWIALENDVDVSDDVIVSGTVNTSVAGLYKLTYSAVNSDGFAKTATRQVIVYDTTPSVIESGIYSVSAASNRNGVLSTEYASKPDLVIYQTAPGVFYISDLFGGYYNIGRGYGEAYAIPATLNFDGTNLRLIKAGNTPWGDTFSGVTGTYDAASKTLNLAADYAAYVFNLIIIKQ